MMINLSLRQSSSEALKQSLTHSVTVLSKSDFLSLTLIFSLSLIDSVIMMIVTQLKLQLNHCPNHSQ